MTINDWALVFFLRAEINSKATRRSIHVCFYISSGKLNLTSKESSCVLGHIENHSRFVPVVDLKDTTDFK